MTNPLDGNGVAAWPPRDWQCPECSYRSYCTFDADKGGPGSDLRCLNCKAVFRAPPAPSHTAVEPVAELVERLRDIVTEFDNEVADMMSNDGAERADLWVDVDVPIGIVRQADSALTAQAAALVAAEKERDDFRSSLATTIGKLMLAEARVAELEAAGNQIEPYLAFAIGPESPGYHPTMPSAVASFRATLARRLTHQEKNNGR